MRLHIRDPPLASPGAPYRARSVSQGQKPWKARAPGSEAARLGQALCSSPAYRVQPWDTAGSRITPPDHPCPDMTGGRQSRDAFYSTFLMVTASWALQGNVLFAQSAGSRPWAYPEHQRVADPQTHASALVLKPPSTPHTTIWPHTHSKRHPTYSGKLVRLDSPQTANPILRQVTTHTPATTYALRTQHHKPGYPNARATARTPPWTGSSPPGCSTPSAGGTRRTAYGRPCP